MRISKKIVALTLVAGPLLSPAASLAQQGAPMQQGAPVNQAPSLRAKREVPWGPIGFGPRFSTLYNIPRQQFAMGGGAVIRLHPAAYPRKPVSFSPVELELELGYDRYLGAPNYELSYGGSGILYLHGGKVQPYLIASGHRSLGILDGARDVRWHLGGGLGVGYRTRKFFLALEARSGGFLALGKTTLPQGEGTVELKLVGVVYAF